MHLLDLFSGEIPLAASQQIEISFALVERVTFYVELYQNGQKTNTVLSLYTYTPEKSLYKIICNILLNNSY